MFVILTDSLANTEELPSTGAHIQLKLEKLTLGFPQLSSKTLTIVDCNPSPSIEQVI